MLRTRVLTALLLLLVLAAAAAISKQALIVVGAAFLAMALYEWLCLSAVPSWAAVLAAATACAMALAFESFGVAPTPEVLAALCALACCAWLALGVLLIAAQRGSVHLGRALLVGGGFFLGGIAWLALVDLLQAGSLWTLSVLALVWLADIAAYFSGRAFGKAKLASRISPGKTWAGVWGALAAVLVVAEAVRWLWPEAGIWSTHLLRAAPAAGIGILVLLVASSIIGDLFESLVKRRAGVKDSGWVLPGHGGVWDRIDASLPVLPLAVLSQWIVVNGWLRA